MIGFVLMKSGKAGMKPLAYCVHFGMYYFYAKNANGTVSRVYVKPGESVDWAEVPDPVFALAA